MAGYDDNNDALTLGDDDALRVGDYELQYDSTSGDWEAVYTPTGDTATVPTSQSGSLFPTDLADALAGQALADDGNLYSSIQNAENAASDWVFVGPGTFNEAVTIDTAGLTLMGSGYSTFIDAGSLGSTAVTATVDNVRLKHFRAGSDTGQGANAYGVETTGQKAVIDDVSVTKADSQGIRTMGIETTIKNCYVTNAGSNQINISGNGTIIINCYTDVAASSSASSINVNCDESIVASCAVFNSSDNGINISNDNDNIVIGNRVHNSSDRGITPSGADNIIANNRVSDSTNADIDDNGTGTVLDGNSTGASN